MPAPVIAAANAAAAAGGRIGAWLLARGLARPGPYRSLGAALNKGAIAKKGGNVLMGAGGVVGMGYPFIDMAMSRDAKAAAGRDAVQMMLNQPSSRAAERYGRMQLRHMRGMEEMAMNRSLADDVMADLMRPNLHSVKGASVTQQKVLADIFARAARGRGM